MDRMPVTSHDPALRRAASQAESHIRRREVGAFSSVRGALEWWGKARRRMQAPNSMHPRTELVNRATGERAQIRVDGGKGGDLDGTFATIATVGEALAVSRREEPMGTAALVESVAEGTSQQVIADRQRVPASTLSYHVGKAERIIGRELAAAGLL